MNISAEDFRQHFELLSDETLLATNRDDLVDAAKAVYDEEVMRRGLLEEEPLNEAVTPADADMAPDADMMQDSGGEGKGPEELVTVGSFTILDEARLARGLLQSAEIPAGLVNDKASLGLLHLMVPASFEEAALQVLGGEISEEELAAQAEAAGFASEDERDQPGN